MYNTVDSLTNGIDVQKCSFPNSIFEYLLNLNLETMKNAIRFLKTSRSGGSQPKEHLHWFAQMNMQCLIAFCNQYVASLKQNHWQRLEARLVTKVEPPPVVTATLPQRCHAVCRISADLRNFAAEPEQTRSLSGRDKARVVRVRQVFAGLGLKKESPHTCDDK